MVAEHGGGGADEGSVDGGVEAVAAMEGVAAGVARSGLARGAAVEDVVEVGERLRRADASRRGEAQGEVGAVLSNTAGEMLAAFLTVARLEALERALTLTIPSPWEVEHAPRLASLYDYDAGAFVPENCREDTFRVRA